MCAHCSVQFRLELLLLCSCPCGGVYSFFSFAVLLFLFATGFYCVLYTHTYMHTDLGQAMEMHTYHFMSTCLFSSLFASNNLLSTAFLSKLLGGLHQVLATICRSPLSESVTIRILQCLMERETISWTFQSLKCLL